MSSFLPASLYSLLFIPESPDTDSLHEAGSVRNQSFWRKKESRATLAWLHNYEL